MLLENQFVRYENLLSYRARIKRSELHRVISFAQSNIDALGLKVVGNIIFTISERIENDNDEILGIEILIPIDKPFESQGQCVYKPIFKLENAVSSRYCGVISNSDVVEKKMLSYISLNNMRAITNFYYVVQETTADFSQNSIVDVYIGIDCNTL